MAARFSQLTDLRFGPRRGFFRNGSEKRRHGDDARGLCETFDHRDLDSDPPHVESGQPCMPLALVSAGSTVAIHSIQGGDRLRQRLIDLGLNCGSRVRVVKNDMPGPLIIAVKEDGRLALGRGMTQRILVTQTDIDTPAGA